MPRGEAACGVTLIAAIALLVLDRHPNPSPSPSPSPKPSPNPNPNRNPKQEVNGKPVYEKDPSTMPMVWASNGYWYVGKRDELGKQAGWMQARP